MSRPDAAGIARRPLVAIVAASALVSAGLGVGIGWGLARAGTDTAEPSRSAGSAAGAATSTVSGTASTGSTSTGTTSAATGPGATSAATSPGATGSGPAAVRTASDGTLLPASGVGSTLTGLAAQTAARAPIAAFSCPTTGTTVTTADALQRALTGARAGTVIIVAPGVYTGEFTASARGDARRPIWLCGRPGAVLQGRGWDEGYVLHLDGAVGWRIAGLTVRHGQKGVMVDGGSGNALQGLTVEDIGDEAVHLRRDTTGNVVRECVVRDTGHRRPKFGEGVYVGTAVSNWPVITAGRPDHSDGNWIVQNTISATTAESVDVKEGTTSGVLVGNSYDGSGLTDADSWVDVKGDRWLVVGDVGRVSPGDGFQTHTVVDGWGEDNRFAADVADLAGGTGVGFYVHRHRLGTVVTCDDRVVGGGELSNIDCTA